MSPLGQRPQILTGRPAAAHLRHLSRVQRTVELGERAFAPGQALQEGRIHPVPRQQHLEPRPQVSELQEDLAQALPGPVS